MFETRTLSELPIATCSKVREWACQQCAASLTQIKPKAPMRARLLQQKQCVGGSWFQYDTNLPTQSRKVAKILCCILDTPRCLAFCSWPRGKASAGEDTEENPQNKNHDAHTVFHISDLNGLANNARCRKCARWLLTNKSQDCLDENIPVSCIIVP